MTGQLERCRAVIRYEYLHINCSYEYRCDLALDHTGPHHHQGGDSSDGHDKGFLISWTQ